MDPDAAFQHLAEYRALVLQGQSQPWLSRERRATVKTLDQLLPTINQTLCSLAPDLAPINAHLIVDHAAALPRIDRALNLLRRSKTMASEQWTGGGPALPLSLLDPVIGEAALPLWDAAKYRQAVSDAASSLNSYAQGQVGRHDISDKDLMAQAFSDKDPERGKSRLRCPGNPDSETVRSQQEGARAFAIGTYQAIRNPAHHLTGDWNPLTAFHDLVALSKVAHWFRHWDVVRYMPPMPDISVINVAQTGAPTKVNRRTQGARQPTEAHTPRPPVRPESHADLRASQAFKPVRSGSSRHTNQ